jgi:general L-amino acid transport system substrate-binding protein
MIKVIIILILTTLSSYASQTRDNVMKRGYLNCGVSQGMPGFSNIDKNGNWTGIDIDFCKAIAVAVLGDSNKVKFIPISQRDRFEVVKNNEVDILARNLTWTFTREVDTGLTFVRISYYDNDGFMVRKNSNIKNAIQLNNSNICTTIGSTSETGVRDFFDKKNLKYSVISFRDWDETVLAYDSKRCDAIVADFSFLNSIKSKLKDKNEHLILDDIINKQPTGILIRHNDKNWKDIISWTINVLIIAEEEGITSKNIDLFLKSKIPEIKRLTGEEGNFGSRLGLSNEWSYNIIKQVGNYEEIFEKNLGSKSNLHIPRGMNKLWKDGGLMYAPPLK